MQQIILIIHIITCIALIALILLQQGKGAETGASFGSGASQTVFGAQGSGNLLSHITAGLATLFFITTLTLGILATRQEQVKSIDELLNKAEQQQENQSQSQENQPVETDQGDIPKVPAKQ